MFVRGETDCGECALIRSDSFLTITALFLAAPGLLTAQGYDQTVKPFLQQNCLACHSEAAKVADVNVEALMEGAVAEDVDLWEKVAHKIRTGEMPPAGFPKPEESQAKTVSSWISAELDRIERATPPNPGNVTAQRLNRAEYNNTVRDLFGIDIRPADDFPQDDSGYGFDNIGDVLSLSPVLMEKYFAAAQKVVRTAIFGPEPMQPQLVRHQPPYREYPLSDDPLFDYDESGLSMPQSLHTTHYFPVDGEYSFNVVPEGRRPNASEPVQMGVWIDGKLVKSLEVDAPSDIRSQDLFGQAKEFRMHVPAGEHWIAGSVLKLYEGLPPVYEGPNPSKRPPATADDYPLPPDLKTPEEIQQYKDRLNRRLNGKNNPANRVYIHYIEITGPYDQKTGPAPESLGKVFTCGHLDTEHTDACPRKIVGDMARRAFRRPVTEAELQPYLGLFAKSKQGGAPFNDSIAGALQALLVSPDFLFRIETSGAPSDKIAGAVRISQYELASRLSYFLWSSTPDEELLDVADQGKLREPAVLEAQVRRMLQDPKSEAFVKNFAGQWLETRRLESVAPDYDKFPEFEAYLRMSMEKETELFFANILKNDLSILEFVAADYTFMNQRLAEHYGIKDVKGHEFRRVNLADTNRRGVITHGSVLTVSSYTTRTSPVLRGKWVLENILNAPPPPPPPNVPALEEAKTEEGASLREQMEAHRANATCASCHARMDPIGFGLENFNAIGAWRTKDGEFDIDPAGQLPDGREFSGPNDLIELILGDKDDFGRGLTEKMLTYALGRGMERYDRRTVREIAQKVAEQDYRFSSLVLEIVNSLPFQMRGGNS